MAATDCKPGAKVLYLKTKQRTIKFLIVSLSEFTIRLDAARCNSVPTVSTA